MMIVSCNGCKKRCCEHLADVEKQLKKERKKRKKLEKLLKAAKS